MKSQSPTLTSKSRTVTTIDVVPWAAARAGRMPTAPTAPASLAVPAASKAAGGGPKHCWVNGLRLPKGQLIY